MYARAAYGVIQILGANFAPVVACGMYMLTVMKYINIRGIIDGKAIPDDIRTMLQDQQAAFYRHILNTAHGHSVVL
jgi:hypothetical protein